MPAWIDLAADTVFRYTKETTGLKRTIHVFKAYGRICVQVLCKTKGGLHGVGEGAFKRGKRSVEWLTKSLWVQYVPLVCELHSKVLEGLSVQDALKGGQGIFPQVVGRGFYTSKIRGSVKFSFFGPLRDGNCNRIYMHTAQKVSIARQLLKGLYNLESANVTHSDLQLSNLLFYEDSKGKICVEINDFDGATIVPFNLAERRENTGIAKDSSFTSDLEFISKALGWLGIDPVFVSSMSQLSARQCLAQFEAEFPDTHVMEYLY
jgi:hypothetical protein